MNGERALVDSFVEIERRHAGIISLADPDEARQRIVARLQESAEPDDVQEFRCPMSNDWDIVVFHALLTRYGIKPYRYRSQRKATVLVRLSKRFMDHYLWPIFTELCQKLHTHFSALTGALLPHIAPGPYQLTVLDHDHQSGELCPNCLSRLVEQGDSQR